MQVTDRPSPDAPFSNPGNNCANGLLQREQGGKEQKNYTENKLRGLALKVPAFELVLSVYRVIVRTHAPYNDTNKMACCRDVCPCVRVLTHCQTGHNFFLQNTGPKT